MGKNEVATKQSFSMVLADKLDSVSNVLPADFNKARFVQNTLALLNDNPELAKYGQTQILSGLTKGAFLGLDFMSKECYLIPYGSKLEYQTSYKGDVKLARKYSTKAIRKIEAEIVREGDDFQYGTIDGKTTYRFNPKPFNSAKIIGAFAVCVYEDGDLTLEMMSLADLENTRSASRAKNSPAWSKFTGEMYKKTVLRRLCKRIPIDFETPEQVKAFDAGMEIETDTAEIVKNEIEVEANAVEFEEDYEDEVPMPVLRKEDSRMSRDMRRVSDGSEAEVEGTGGNSEG